MIGRYVMVPNPCTTRPCLPGMAYALQTPTDRYYLTRAGRWSATATAWGGYAPQIGDPIYVTGVVDDHVDAFGKPYLTLEAASVSPAQAGLDSGDDRP